LQEVRLIKEKMKPIKSKLEGYHRLPPVSGAFETRAILIL